MEDAAFGALYRRLIDRLEPDPSRLRQGLRALSPQRNEASRRVLRSGRNCDTVWEGEAKEGRKHGGNGHEG